MSSHGSLQWTRTVRVCLISFLLLFSYHVHASFIESTIGTAVVNDATATDNNPAALTLLENSQLITLGSVAYFHSHFKGSSVESITGFTQFGSSTARTHYYFPSVYIGIPATKNVTVGFGIVYNNFYTDLVNGSLLRYVQSNNHINSIDFIPAVGVKVNDFLALGAGLNISHVNMLLQPISGLPSLINLDSQSRHESRATSGGGHIGILLKPTKSTLIGFNYQSVVTYRLSGKSSVVGNPSVTSNHLNFKFWTPARSILSVSQIVTPTLGLIGTIQYIQWSVLKDVNIRGLATTINSQPVILPNVSVNFHLHNAWLFTFGSNYRVTPKWVIRAAGTYMQSPDNPHFQISNGDSIILGVSTGYDISKNFSLDFSYAHDFMKNQSSHVMTNIFLISGVNEGYRNAVSLKLTINL